MLEPLSAELQKLLVELKLCTVRDVRRCRSRVRRLSHDLPAFDSIWIDALVQARKLTSFQAKILESSHPERLQLGPCVLVNRMGRGLTSETFLARRIEGNERCVLKEITLSAEEVSASTERLKKLIENWNGHSHPSITLPHAFNLLDGLPDQPGSRRIVTISRYVSGPHLAELVVRRGRFPAAIVSDLGQQLLGGLAALEQKGVVHGNVRLADIRLTAGGSAVLVDTGVESAIHPELIVRANLAPETYDGIAPELIGTGCPANSVSDLYALGCLLWHLLAGRPPFPTGDPLAKLAAHQSREVPDICEWAPDTPAEIAEVIRRLTHRDPDKRPQSAQKVLEHWGTARKSSHRRLESFRAKFQTSAPRIPMAVTTSSSSRWTMLLAIMFVVSGASLTMLDQGARSELLSLASRVSQKIADKQPAREDLKDESSPTESGNVDGGMSARKSLVASRLRSLPGPDANGVITLTTAGPYAAAEISVVGPLVIRGVEGYRPEIVVTDKPLRIWAEQLVVENVHFRRESVGISQKSPESTSTTLLLVQAQNLAISACSFELRRENRTLSEARLFEKAGLLLPALPEPLNAKNLSNSQELFNGTGGRDREASFSMAVAWKPIDFKDPTGGNIVLRDTVFSGQGATLYLAATPRQVQVLNCLKLNAGALLSLAVAPPTDHQMRVVLQQTTLRKSGPLLQIRPDSKAVALESIVIEMTDCVFDIRSQNALFELFGEKISADWPTIITVNGEGSLISSSSMLTATLGSNGENRTTAETGSMQVEGLAAGSFEYAGLFNSKPQNSVVTKWQAPRRSPNPPGIDPQRLQISGNSR